MKKLAARSFVLKRDGTAVWVLHNASLVDDEQSGSAVIQATMIDITERKGAWKIWPRSGMPRRKQTG